MTSTLHQRPTDAPAAPAAVSGWTATKLVAAREIGVKLRDRAFLISSAVMLVLIAGVTVLPSLFGGGATSVAVVGDAAAAAGQRAGAEVSIAPDEATAETWVRNGDVDAALVADPSGASPFGVAIVANSEAPGDLVAALSAPSPVRLLDPDAVDPAVAFLVPFALSMVFFLTSLTFGFSIAQSVTEEKQTRIVEILVAALPVRALLAGKVLGNTVLAIGQIVLIGAVALIGITVGGADLFSGDVLGQLGTALAWFVPFFLLGFLLLAGLWAVAGAMVARIEDLGSTTTPVQMIVMLPFFAVIYGSSNPTLLAWLSYIPFSAPTAMSVRVFQNDIAGFWEPLLSLAVTGLAAVVFIALAARLYEGSLLRMNGKVSVRQAWAART